MFEGYIDRLPLAHTQLGTWTTTQPRALTGNQTSGLSAGAQSTEPQQPGQSLHFLIQYYKKNTPQVIRNSSTTAFLMATSYSTFGVCHDFLCHSPAGERGQ